MTDITYLTVKKFLNDYRLSGILRSSTLKDLRDSQIIQLADSGLLNIYELIMLSKYFPIIKDTIDKSIRAETSKEKTMVFERPSDTELPVALNAIKFAIAGGHIEEIISRCIFKERQEIEYDRNYVQIIPNIIVEINDTVVLLQKNNKKSRNYNTIGLPAGHVSMVKAAVTCTPMELNMVTFKATVYNELEEELGLKYKDIASLKIIDIIPPVTDPLNVSYYHLGITVLVTVHLGAGVRNAEPDKHDMMFYNDLRNSPEKKIKLENWCIESLLQYSKYKENCTYE